MPRSPSIGLLSAGHACVDVYQGAVASLVPYFAAERHYSYAAVSGIVLAASLLSSIAQPAFGAMTDRRRLPWLLPASAVVAGLGIAASGLTTSYPLTLAMMAVAGLGVAAYHPESARVARAASRGSHQAMGWFSLGGNVGFAVAPLLVGLVVGAGGLGWTPVLLVPALLGAVLCLPAMRAAGPDRRGAAARSGPGGDDWPAFVRLSLVVVSRSVVFVGLSTFVGLHVRHQTGGGLASGSAALAVLYAGGAVGTVLGSRLAQRWDRTRVIAAAYLSAVAAVAGVVLVPGPGVYGFVALASLCLYVPFSLQVTLAQDYLPSRVGTASGVTLGLAVSVGGLTSPLIGALADATSLQVSLLPLIAVPVVSWAAARGLREPAPSVPLLAPDPVRAGPAATS